MCFFCKHVHERLLTDVYQSLHDDDMIVVKEGDLWIARNNWSEVNIHMKVAGFLMVRKYLGSMVQLYNYDKEINGYTCFSAPITLGEGGVYSRSDGVMYTYGTYFPIEFFTASLIENSL